MRTKNTNVLWAITAVLVVAVVSTAVYFGNTATQKGRLQPFSPKQPLVNPVLSVQKSTDSPAMSVATGSNDVVLGRWDLKSNVNMDITQINYAIYRSAPVDLAGTVYFIFYDATDPKGAIPIYSIKGDFKRQYITSDPSNPMATSAAPTPVILTKIPYLAAGKQYKLEALASIPWNAVHNMTYQVSLSVTQAAINRGTTVIYPFTSLVVANKITVLNTSPTPSNTPPALGTPAATGTQTAPAYLTVSQGAAVSANNTVYAGTTNAFLGSFVVRAGSSDVNISNIGVDIKGLADSQLKKITNVRLFRTIGAPGGVARQLGSAQNIFANVNNYSGRKTFAIPDYTLRAGTQDEIRIYAYIDASLGGMNITPFIQPNEVVGSVAFSGGVSSVVTAPANAVYLNNVQIIPGPTQARP